MNRRLPADMSPGGDQKATVGTSAEPFDRWFCGHARQVHGIAWDDGFTAPELVLDYDTSRI